MPTHHQLMLFLDVVKQGSFTKAAALHNMDNSTLSKQIKKLESQLGVQLLNRSTRSFSLTPAGEEILQQVHILQETMADIQMIADSYQSEPKGRLRITSPTFLGQQYLQPVIAQFMHTYPQVKVTLSLDDLKADIISDHFDLAFRLGKLSESSLIAKKIADTHFIIIAANTFVERYGIPQNPEALIKLPAVVYSNSDVTLNQLRITTTPHSNEYQMLKLEGNYQVNHAHTLVDAVKEGLGYAVIDLSNLNRSLKELNLVQLLPDYQISTMDTAIYAVYPHRKQTMLVKEFIKAVQTDIGSPPKWEAFLD